MVFDSFIIIKEINLIKSFGLITIIVLLASAIIICYKILKEKQKNFMIDNQSDIEDSRT